MTSEKPVLNSWCMMKNCKAWELTHQPLFLEWAAFDFCRFVTDLVLSLALGYNITIFTFNLSPSTLYRSIPTFLFPNPIPQPLLKIFLRFKSSSLFTTLLCPSLSTTSFSLPNKQNYEWVDVFPLTTSTAVSWDCKDLVRLPPAHFSPSFILQTQGNTREWIFLDSQHPWRSAGMPTSLCRFQWCDDTRFHPVAWNPPCHWSKIEMTGNLRSNGFLKTEVKRDETWKLREPESRLFVVYFYCTVSISSILTGKETVVLI